MRISLPAQSADSRKNRNVMLVLAAGSFLVIVLTWVQDYVRAYLKDSAYYFSESLLFSTFWWFFGPLLFMQYKIITVTRSTRIMSLLVSTSVLIHSVLFPFMVWVISRFFGSHTFAFLSVFRYTIAEHGYLLVLLYSLPVLSYWFLRRHQIKQDVTATAGQTNTFIEKILVSSGGKKQAIAVQEILYVASATPYISLHTADRKYLHNETLKAVADQLDPALFVRVHKSTIVNISAVLSYTSRLNGDYDVNLKNGVTLRISRNFAASFKQRFG